MATGKTNVKRMVLEELNWDTRIDATNIEVEIVDSSVRLKGSVPSLAVFEAAESAARGVQGVRNVENLLQIDYPGDEPADDKQIEENIRAMLSIDANIKTESVTVNVEDGIVLLTGAVDEFWKKMRVQQMITNMSEVFLVVNKLTVVPGQKVEDQEIADQIRKTIERMGEAKTEYITITVENGNVLVEGKVPHWNAFYAVEYASRNTKGVTGFSNKLIIS